MLTTKVITGLVAINFGQTVGYRATKWWGAEREIKRENCLTPSLFHFVALDAHDGTLDPSRADKLLFHPGWLPDQQTKGVGPNVA